ncbi:MAG: hypothetical protein HRT74_02775 [Flavobacteriales bacterium]|nr:hypothetical protein [Flavobacteriales bacterium]
MKNTITTPLDYELPNATHSKFWNFLFTLNIILLVASIVLMPFHLAGLAVFLVMAPVNLIAAIVALVKQIRQKAEFKCIVGYLVMCLMFFLGIFAMADTQVLDSEMRLTYAIAVPLALSGFLNYLLYKMKTWYGV